MKAYLITSGTIFALMAATHVFLTFDRWQQANADVWSILAPAIVMAISGGLAVWAFRLARRPGTGSTDH